jgi:hypothetical protein
MEDNKTVIRVSYKSKHQIPMIMVTKEYYENGELVYAEVLFQLD